MKVVSFFGRNYTSSRGDTVLTLKMAIRVFFLTVLFRLANSQLPYIRTCDPVPKITTQTPTVCSNYENIKYIYEGQGSLKKKLFCS